MIMLIWGGGQEPQAKKISFVVQKNQFCSIELVFAADNKISFVVQKIFFCVTDLALLSTLKRLLNKFIRWQVPL